MKRFLKYFVVILTALFILSFISCKSIADPLKQSEEETTEEVDEEIQAAFEGNPFMVSTES